jgi:hypothetical protein
MYVYALRKRVSSSELSSLCEMEEDEIIEQMTYWERKSVVHFVINELGMNDLNSQSKIYEVIEDQQANSVNDANDSCGTELEFTDRVSAASEKQHKAVLQEIEKYVLGKTILNTSYLYVLTFHVCKLYIFIGILASNDSMTLERIFTMVKFAELLNNIDMNIVGMRKFLSGMVDVEKLDFEDNCYRARQRL